MAETSIRNIHQAPSLRDLNARLTEVMAKQKIQSLLKDEELLRSLIGSIAQLSTKDPESGPLLAMAVLGRLAAVARGKEEEQAIRSAAGDLLSVQPRSLDELADGEEKFYASQMLNAIDADWVGPYAATEAVAIESAENARAVLLETALHRSGTVSEAMALLIEALPAIGSIASAESRAKRARRIVGSIAELIHAGRWPPGPTPGTVLRDLALCLLPEKRPVGFEDVAIGIAEDILSILVRLIELRFSLALDADSYKVLATCRTRLGRDAWYAFLAQSKYAAQIKVCLSEAALVIARQGRTDRGLVDALLVCYVDRTALGRGLRQHFPGTLEIEPSVKAWWLSGGSTVSIATDAPESPIATSEDQRIGEALLEIEKIDESVRYMASTVKPELEFSNPPGAAALGRISDSYTSLAQNIRLLAKIRLLSMANLRGREIEYNSYQHQMLGGHLDGVRAVRVVRDGIIKKYSNRDAILVKPWVEPIIKKPGE